MRTHIVLPHTEADDLHTRPDLLLEIRCFIPCAVEAILQNTNVVDTVHLSSTSPPGNSTHNLRFMGAPKKVLDTSVAMATFSSSTLSSWVAASLTNSRSASNGGVVAKSPSALPLLNYVATNMLL